MQLIAVSHLFFGFAFTAETSTSGWALQSFVTEPNIKPPVFDINKTGTTADVSGLEFPIPKSILFFPLETKHEG